MSKWQSLSKQLNTMQKQHVLVIQLIFIFFYDNDPIKYIGPN